MFLWLKAPFKMKDGSIVERTSGTPQGGVISPVLANLFLHYTFDKWMERNQPQTPWARYADDGVVHCRTQKEAEMLHHRLEQRFKECGLELHPDKTRIVYCKDDIRSENHSETSFDFLGYTFRARQCKSRYGKYFIGFTPAVSNKALKHIRQTIRHWRIYRKTVSKLEEIAREINPILRGWINYYGRFAKSNLYPFYRHMNKNLVLWARRKYKTLKAHRGRAEHWLGNIAKREPDLFAHWKIGFKPTAG